MNQANLKLKLSDLKIEITKMKTFKRSSEQCANRQTSNINSIVQFTL